MRGYEGTFSDIVDFIVRVTHHIWEERAIGYLYEHYRHNTAVIDDSGVVYGREQVIASTTQMLAAFPDLRLYADAVIWCGDEDQGFWTSHRCVMVGHNTGWSRFGPPTGRPIKVTAIANCISIENQIFAEHVIYNTGSIVRQLGLDLVETARQLANTGQVAGLDDRAAGQVDRLRGQGSPRPMSPDVRHVGDLVERAMHEIWNWRLLNKVGDYCAPNLRFHGPTDRELFGTGAYSAYVLEQLAMFPDAAWTVDDLYWMGNAREGFSVALRWSMVGTHRGAGYLGPPTGRRIHMWGVDHLCVRSERITEIWSVSNEFDVLMQLHSSEPRRKA